MRILSFTNQKGGVGKSTTAQSVGACLREQGKRVLFIDLDAQGNLSYSMNAQPTKTINGVLTGEATAKEAITKTEQGDIIASSKMLAAADSLLTDTGKEYKLREALTELEGLYDYVIIDSPPTLSILTVNALTAATDVIIPAQADIYSLQGLSDLQRTIESVKKYCNHDLRISGIVFTRYNQRATLTKDITEYAEKLAAGLNTRVYETKIRECTAIKEAQLQKQSIFEYAPKSNGAIDYEALTKEILSDEEKKKE